MIPLKRLAVILVLAGPLFTGPAPADPLSPTEIRVLKVASPDLPVVHLEAVVLSGSADDPAGREGLAFFTANLMRRGTDSLTRERIDETLNLASASLSVVVLKDAIVFSGSASVENLEAFYGVFRDVILRPAFDAAEMEKARTDQKNAIEAVRRNDEAVAAEMLDALLYRNHPYGHLGAGRTGAVETITRDEVVAFYRTHLRKGNVVLGLAGAVDDALVERVRRDFSALPDGAPERSPRAAAQLPRRRVLLVEKGSSSQVRIGMGHPIAVTRAHADYFPLRIACAHLGERRESLGRLDREISSARRISDGAYASIEHVPGQSGAVNLPLSGIPRREQAFSLWIQPEIRNAKFAIKLALAELGDLLKDGISQGRLEEVKSFIASRCASEMETPGGALAAALDEILDGTPGFTARCAGSVERVTTEAVATAVRAHLRPDRVGIVAVVGDAGALIEEMLSPATTLELPSGVDAGRTQARDREVSAMDLGLTREDFEVVKAADLFR